MKEVDLYTSVVDKLQKKYPAYFENLIHEFSEEYNIKTEDELKEMTKQIIYSWLFLDYIMIDGKKLVDFCSQALDLTKNEILMLEKIKNAKRGLFEIKRGIIKANIVYNLENKLFLFGGVQKVDKKQAEQYLIKEGLQ